MQVFGKLLNHDMNTSNKVNVIGQRCLKKSKLFLIKNNSIKLFFTLLNLFLNVVVFSQPNTTIDLDKIKPKQYEERKLNSEKTGEKKFGVTRKFFQNTVTHYNYYFNANTKLNDIITAAKMATKDDYTQLLSFYNYSLDATSKEKQQLDSVIYKCNAGILLHDLRNNWVDDLYLLLGKSFLFKKNFDSATQVFQYINYSYAPKDDGYDILLGSNSSNTNGIFTIATNEQNKFTHKLAGKLPARNESFLWQARNYLEQNKLAEASGLLSILRNDPFFPQRLQINLHEIIAYSFYKQQMYDSAAWHLQKSLANATNKAELSRWEFLGGQLYQLAKKNEAAIFMFQQSIKHNIDPYLEVYARLNIVSLSAINQKENALQENLIQLYKLAKRDKFENYRDIIYYATALLQLQQKKETAAVKDLSKSIRFTVDNPLQKTKSFLLLADINYNHKLYAQSSKLYDSIETNLIFSIEKEKVELRKTALKTISINLLNIHLQDSLLHLSTLPETDRLMAVKKMYKQLRKEQGLKELDDFNFEGSSSFFDSNKVASTDLFSNVNTAINDFYFLNTSLKLQGLREFKLSWGNRPNVDNWRRQSVLNKIAAQQNNANVFSVDVDIAVAPNSLKGNTAAAFTPEGLLLNIPLTDKKIKLTNDSIANSIYQNGIIFQNTLKNYSAAIESYQSLLNRYPNHSFAEKIIFNLAYCYLTKEDISTFDSLKNVLNKKYPDGIWTYKINKGEFLNRNDSTVVVTSFKKDFIAKEYEHIYNLFIEGKFEQAKAEKEKADFSFGNKFWTPQLLFIESVYYIKQKKDSIAINRLQNLQNNFAGTPLSEKAKTMINVLQRRKEIENYLTNLQIDEEENIVNKRVNLNAITPVKAASIEPIKKDSIAKISSKEIKSTEIKLMPKPIVASINGFTFVANDAHYTLVIFDKVDEVFTREALNAFNRFNLENYYNKKINLTSINLNNQYNLLVVGPFRDASEAIDYSDIIMPLAKSRIIPWLTKDKYTFGIISDSNLTLVKINKEISAYTKFIHQIFPNKF